MLPQCQHCTSQSKSFFTTSWGLKTFHSLYLALKAAGVVFRRFQTLFVAKLVRALEGWLLPKYKKKALLVGLQYKGNSQLSELKHAHEDVRAFKNLLTSVYGYEEKDIVVMLDGGEAGEHSLEPTMPNLLREIEALVKDAQPGDRFVFHFSGHSLQVKNRTGTERDGLDEAISTSDNKKIIDNILKKHLVDPLKVGCSLVAIFDTCHSASLLDLKHHRCNRVYVPWVSKSRSSITIEEHQRTSTDQVTSRQSSHSIHPPNSRQPTRITTKTLSTHLNSVHEEGCSLEVGAPLCSSPIASERYDSPVEDLESSRHHFGESVFGEYNPKRQSTDCDGFQRCEDPTYKVPLANVLAIGACKDEQQTWEEDGGKSMTATLIEMLEQRPNPCIQCLMLGISYHTHETVRKMHTSWMKIKEDAEMFQSSNAPLTPYQEQVIETYEKYKDHNKYQEPQLASHTKVNMRLRFRL